MSIQNETVISIGAGCREFPPNGVSDATMARFIQKGVKVKATGEVVKLVTFKIGGRRFTSLEAIQRFIQAQNADESRATPAITPQQRRQQSEAAQAELEKMGVSGGGSRTIARPTKDFIATTGVANQLDSHPHKSPQSESCEAR